MDDLIHFIFASDDDKYYRDDLTAVDLNEKLWLDLHDKYSCVYYLTANTEGDGFDACTFGDRNRRDFRESGLLKKAIRAIGQNGDNEFGQWMLERLKDKTVPSAFVCPLEDFCKICGRDSWQPVLERIAAEKKRTGVIVLTVPLTAEESMPLFLKSKVFKSLGEEAVISLQSGKEYDIYSYILRRKPRGCDFLNRFTRDSVYPILLRLTLTDDSRFLSDSELDRLTDYLVSYLNDPVLQHENPILDWDMPTEYMRFRDLYEMLENRSVWDKAVAASREAVVSSTDVRTTKPAIIRDRTTLAGRLIAEHVPPELLPLDTGQERAGDILNNIRRQLMSPKSLDENNIVIKRMDELYDRLDSSVKREDIRTYILILKAIRWCVSRLYVKESEREANNAVQRTIDQFFIGIEHSEKLWQIERNILLNSVSGVTGQAMELALIKLKAIKQAEEKKLSEYHDALNAYLLTSGITADTELTNELERINREMEEISSISRNEDAAVVPEPEPKPDSEQNYNLELEDYSFIPPTNY